MTEQPVRIQRKRTKGWRKPEGALFVGRGSGWGNSWKIGSTGHTVLPGGWVHREPHPPLTREQAIACFINAHAFDIEYLRHARVRLAGIDLMCWCPLDKPCHADWLLQVANSPLPLEDFVDRTPKPNTTPTP
ncbi:DUF4326 domain-containing protein [Streptomyces sp. ok210]|uniref:DUF4326 domain-containing protein n=1 Tax=Streptomyces sp. ok210 TaxID=1761905 RepID=UPI0008E5609D|nr:DUF4326 domain-containing protein [Streptomyces sp. ok210]SFT31852.1 protein of unknown function [Streptomyces sp. ok210]